ncbi:MAG: alpha-2-macroglobulin family protein, partial [Verrucomicrobiota bacterium]
SAAQLAEPSDAAPAIGGGGNRGGEMKQNSFGKDALESTQAALYFLAGSEMEVEEKRTQGPGGSGGSMMEATVRSEFADTAFWKADIVTDENGEAEIEVPMPDNLTTWKIKVWGLGHGTVVGEGEAEVITSKDLLVRLQAPRFFVEKDEVVLSANVHNYLKGERTVEVSLGLEGDHLKAMKDNLKQTVRIDGGGEERVDWRIKVQREGEVNVTMTAATTDDADAMEMSFPVYVHGALRTESWSGVLRPDENRAGLTINVPGERRPDESKLEIRYSPSIAMAMVDALPYLATYPHKNCESVINRFVPAVLTQKILQDMDIDLAELRDKVTNLNPQEIGDDKERAEQWNKRKKNPIFEKGAIDRLVKTGLADLTALQNGDGGWGWTPRSKSGAHTTALVVHGLKLAKDNGLALVPNVLERGVKWLENHQKDEVRKLKNAPTKTKPYKSFAGNLDAFVFNVLVETSGPNNAMLDYLYRDRLRLSKYSQALFGLALDAIEENDKRDMIVRNLTQFLVKDDENQSAWLDLRNGGYWWTWYGNQIEAQAAYLKLLTRTAPESEVTSGLVKYLLNNRKHATYWNSTRDTSFCLEAIAGYIRATGEDKPDMTVRILIDGEEQKEIKITPDNFFTYDNLVMLKGKAVTTGEHKIEFRRKGKGPLYYNAYFTTFSLEDFIEKAGLEIKVDRKYYKLVPENFAIKSTGSRGEVVDRRVDKFKRVELKSGDEVNSGDLVEVELVIQSKNDYEHLLFEDYKPAGFESVDLRSGHRYNGLGAYMELRDERVSFQVRRLTTGTHSLTYRLRAEIPGRFSALPAQGNGMYAPELRANSDEIKLSVKDQ